MICKLHITKQVSLMWENPSFLMYATQQKSAAYLQKTSKKLLYFIKLFKLIMSYLNKNSNKYLCMRKRKLKKVV